MDTTNMGQTMANNLFTQGCHSTCSAAGVMEQSTTVKCEGFPRMLLCVDESLGCVLLHMFCITDL